MFIAIEMADAACVSHNNSDVRALPRWMRFVEDTASAANLQAASLHPNDGFLTMIDDVAKLEFRRCDQIAFGQVSPQSAVNKQPVHELRFAVYLPFFRGPTLTLSQARRGEHVLGLPLGLR